ncbi:hypothetical protein PL75_03125 [Neisseria arctica]|uniref:Uncharacterized protein n=1 Tax=Neisseria arctica TaxID=1470200 RepID=A0A0J0YSZ8_9NEIS|nr:hypothetical protein [Neisseria arctica]KLT73239.1 hypothetical protein PL75_03125 [Neisseria arctica]UOO87514.1 hypothetical protein LVJ86_04515 [Neisseria arctica]
MLENFKVIVGYVDGVPIYTDLLSLFQSAPGNSGKSLEDFKNWFFNLSAAALPGADSGAPAPTLAEVQLSLAKEAGYQTVAEWLQSFKETPLNEPAETALNSIVGDDMLKEILSLLGENQDGTK